MTKPDISLIDNKQQLVEHDECSDLTQILSANKQTKTMENPQILSKQLYQKDIYISVTPHPRIMGIIHCVITPIVTLECRSHELGNIQRIRILNLKDKF